MSGRRQAAAGPVGSVEGLWALPEGWRWERLDTVGSWGAGGTPDAKNPAYYGGDIPWYRSGELKDQRLGRSELTISPLGLKQSSAKIVPENSLLIAMYGATVGKLGITTTPCATNQAIAFCNVGDDFDLQFLFYYLLFRRPALKEQAKGGAQPNISQQVLKRQLVPVPPVAIQRQIVARIDELFTELDDGEAALQRARDDLETYGKALLKAAVTGELTAGWRAAHPPTESGEQLLHRLLADRKSRWDRDQRNRGKLYKEPVSPNADQLPVLPESWTWASIGQITDKTEYGTSVKCSADPTGTPVLRMGNIQDGELVVDDLKYAPATEKVPFLSDGELLFNRTNSAELVGKSAVYRGELSPCSYASYIFVVRLDEVSAEYVCSYLNSIFGKAWVAANKSQQVGQANLSAGTLMNMPIPLPPLQEQAQIVDAARHAKASSRSLGDQVILLATRSQSLRQSILNAAFQGDLVA